jgi:hypothetical protein
MGKRVHLNYKKNHLHQYVKFSMDWCHINLLASSAKYLLLAKPEILISQVFLAK